MNIMARFTSPYYVDITVSSEDSTRQIIHEVKPDWNRQDLQEKSLFGGIVNQMTCYYQKEDKDMTDAIVVRVFNESCGDTTIREKEFLAAQITHAAGSFPQIYASFNNGFVYQYAIGRNPNFYDITKLEFVQKLTRKLYSFHCCDFKNLTLKNLQGLPTAFEPVPLTIERKGALYKIPANPKLDPEGAIKFQMLRKEFTHEYLAKEFRMMKNILDEISLPLSMCHMDLHPNNMLLNPATGDITFVDFELSGYHYSYFDLAYFFAVQLAFGKQGFIAPDEPAFTDEHRTIFLREYLHAK